VITDVGQEDEIVQREVFGPVVTVPALRRRQPGDRVGQRRQLRPGRIGLDARRGRALNAGARLQFGTVWINDHIPLVSEMPHGGYKQSGYGKDLARTRSRTTRRSST
jgi:acyl-CoA reductase-like NAD-dependent aldehyde dehydrogenase